MIKKITFLLATFIITLSSFSQAPNKMSYQAIIRDASDALIANQTVGIQISVLQGSSTGTAVYVETQTPTTNANGLATLEIGSGTVVSGDFSAIDWSSDTYFITTETDPAGGTNYSITGTSQFLSVPYAFFANNSAASINSPWTLNDTHITNSNTGNVIIGSNITNPNLNFTVTNNASPKMGIGNNGPFNNTNSGELHFVENTGFAEECGIKFQHNGERNDLYLIGACTTPDTIARFNRNKMVNLRTLKIGNNITSNNSWPLYVEGNSVFEGNSNITGSVTISGDLTVTGNIAKAGGTFKIDHPLDPTNKYLVHSFVESPEMMNIYSGNAKTDANGYATVNLPSYFESANKDFRYQLTTIGSFSQVIVKEKIANNKFIIQSSEPNIEVSWQVTAVRADKYANENRIQAEQEKPLKGTYLHPELYNAGEEKSEAYQRKLEMSKKSMTSKKVSDADEN